MFTRELNQALASFQGFIQRLDTAPGLEEGAILGTTIQLGDATVISLAYWRLSRGAQPLLSSFDHGSARSGPSIDAGAELRSHLMGTHCSGLRVDPASGDLLVVVEGALELRGFRLRSLFEDWEVRGPTGEAYWSNYVEFGPH